MTEKEVLKPVDLGHLEQKAIMIVDCFRKANASDRSPEYRAFHIKQAENIAESLVGDFGYYMDKYMIGGVEPYGLSDFKHRMEKTP